MRTGQQRKGCLMADISALFYEAVLSSPEPSKQEEAHCESDRHPSRPLKGNFRVLSSVASPRPVFLGAQRYLLLSLSGGQLPGHSHLQLLRAKPRFVGYCPHGKQLTHPPQYRQRQRSCLSRHPWTLPVMASLAPAQGEAQGGPPHIRAWKLEQRDGWMSGNHPGWSVGP